MRKPTKLLALIAALAAMALVGPTLAHAVDEPSGDNGHRAGQVESEEANQLGVQEPDGDNNQLGQQVESEENQLGVQEDGLANDGAH